MEADISGPRDLPIEVARVIAVGPRAVEALRNLHALALGECPSLLNEDSGGDAKLAMEIEEILATVDGA